MTLQANAERRAAYQASEVKDKKNRSLEINLLIFGLVLKTYFVQYPAETGQQMQQNDDEKYIGHDD